MKKLANTSIALAIALFSAHAETTDSTRIIEPEIPEMQLVVKKNNVEYLVDSLHTDYPEGSEMGYERTYYRYDNKNQLIQTIAHWTDRNHDTTGGMNELREYDANGNRTLLASYSYDPVSGEWMPSFQTINSYDANGNATLEIRCFGMEGKWDTMYTKHMEYDGLNRLVSSLSETEKVEYEYLGETGNITSQTSYMPGVTEGEWTPSFRFSYTYDESLNRTAYVTSVWLGTEWFDGSKIEYSGYNEQGDYANFKEYEMGETEWILRSEIIFTYQYDEAGNAIEETETQVNSFGDSIFYKRIYEYDLGCEEMPNILYENYQKESSAAPWAGVQKFEYVYDNCIWVDFFEYGWDAATEEWNHVRRNQIELDENGCTEYETELYWDSENETWVATLYNHWFYSAHEIVANELGKPSNVRIYAQERSISIMDNYEQQSIEAYDMTGRCVGSIRKPSIDASIPVKITGVYIVKVGNEVRKIFVR